MEARISLITLGVANLSLSKKFYEDLGFTTTWDAEKGVVFFKTNGTVLSLFGMSDLVKDIGGGVGERGFSGITIAHNTKTEAEVDEAINKAISSGGRLVKKAHKTFWGGYSGYFADPDGHLWEVAHGAFPFKADGHLDIT